MSISRPNILQKEDYLKTVPDEALRAMLLQMGQNGQVGSPEYILAAGEMQARKNVRQQAQMGQSQQPPVIAELLTGIQAPQGQPQPQQAQPQPAMPPAEAGVASLPAPNLEPLAQSEYATGGVVAFSNGNEVKVPSVMGLFGGPSTRTAVGQPSMLGGIMFNEYGVPIDAADLRRKLRAENPDMTAGEIEAVVNRQIKAKAQPPVTAAPQSISQLAPTAPAQPAAQPGIANLTGTTPASATAATSANAAPYTVREISKKTDIPDIPVYEAPKFGDPVAQAKKMLPTPDFLTTPEKEQTPVEGYNDRIAFYKAIGVDMDPNKLRREQIEKELTEGGDERTKAGLWRLAEFGFNWASQNGPTLVAAAKAGKEVAPGIISDIKELDKLNRERNKELAGIAVLDAQMKRTTADSVYTDLQRKKERREDRMFDIDKTRAGIAATLASNQINAQTSLATASMSARATIAKLQEQLGLTQTKDIVDAAIKLIAGPEYNTADSATQDKMLADAIKRVLRGRAAAEAPTVTKQ